MFRLDAARADVLRSIVVAQIYLIFRHKISSMYLFRWFSLYTYWYAMGIFFKNDYCFRLIDKMLAQ